MVIVLSVRKRTPNPSLECYICRNYKFCYKSLRPN